MDTIVILNIGTAVFAVGLFADLMFDFDYGLSVPWYRSWIGWMFMLNGAAVVSAGLAILLGRTLGPDYPGRPWVTLGAYSIFTVSTILRYGVFVMERRHPGSRLPMPWFDRELDPALSHLSSREKVALKRAEARAVRQSRRDHHR